MQLCQYLGEQVGEERCESCRGSVRIKVFNCQHPNHDTTKLEECRRCADFSLPQVGAHIVRWMVGITTAPREQPTLERTVDSLVAAGWDHPHVFAEPETKIPEKYTHLKISHRPRTMGAFPNWLLALLEMVLNEPLADAYFLCQDDVLFSLGLREYLEQKLWPSHDVGVVSVYCPSHYERSNQFGFHSEDHGYSTWGALAYVFPNPAARSLLSDPSVLDHRPFGPDEGQRHIDCVVGRWCQAKELGYYVHSPSLARHIGETSTIWTGSNQGQRQAKTFVPDVSHKLSSPVADIAGD